MSDQIKQNILLFVIGKYGRPIGIQQLQRGLRNQLINYRPQDFDWVTTLANLEKNGLIERQDGFPKLTQKGEHEFEKNITKWTKGEFGL